MVRFLSRQGLASVTSYSCLYIFCVECPSLDLARQRCVQKRQKAIIKLIQLLIYNHLSISGNLFIDLFSLFDITQHETYIQRCIIVCNTHTIVTRNNAEHIMTHFTITE